MQIDPRIRAKEFMALLSVGKTKFYNMIKRGEIAEPIRLSEKDVFWYASYVKDKVEEHKNSDIVAA
jgi:prophage regulatory protein